MAPIARFFEPLGFLDQRGWKKGVIPMGLGLGQILLIALAALLLFGNFPRLWKDLGKGVAEFRRAVDSPSSSSSETKGVGDGSSAADSKETSSVGENSKTGDR